MIRSVLKTLLILWIFVPCCTISAQADYMEGPVEAKVLRVIDGDTVKVRARVWLGQTLDVAVRIRGIDAPELDGACAIERRLARRSKERLTLLINSRSDARTVYLRHISGGKYHGRVIASLELPSGADAGKQLLAENLVKPYQRNAPDRRFCQKT